LCKGKVSRIFDFWHFHQTTPGPRVETKIFVLVLSQKYREKAHKKLRK
jgi:hypothetical protein